MQGAKGAWEKPLQRQLNPTSTDNMGDPGISSSSSSKQSRLHPSVTNQLALSSDEDSDSGEDGQRDIDVQKSVFSGYPGVARDNDAGELFHTGVSKISSLLVATKSGTIACLICLEKVRKVDPIWHCKQGCFAVIHLVCIQSWSRQSSNSAAERSVARLSSAQFPSAAQHALENSCWHCPKCRTEYPRSEIPREYRCYCGKEVDPAPDPWLTPHTCGERCEQPLESCDHTCMLLCHPGPCPPCPQLVHLKCHCGKQKELRRCGQNSFSCRKLCNRPLLCGVHNCEKICHEGDCGPCNMVGMHSCRCGHLTEVRPCSEADFQCERTCEKELTCKKHRCGKRCHAGPCGDCELQGRRTCPCGKEEYRQISCDAKVPTCGSTCEKLLNCGLHRCPERCHSGPCAGTCRILVNKSCRCGSLKKEVPCFQDLVCEKKCQNIRNCHRHACRRRCCDGDCASCSEVCARKLRCGNHKCPAPCHRGLCAPCPLTVKISCACGFTTLEVPCGADKDVRPPRCAKRCLTPQTCGHGEQCKPHRCHYGACPPCRLLCDKELSCGHRCKETCHGSHPPPKQEYLVKGKKKRVNGINPGTGTPCPPCSQLVLRQCMGKHPEGAKLVACSDDSLFSCESLCGNLLSCGNHHCQKSCHIVTIPRTLGDEASTDLVHHELRTKDSCSNCSLKCQKKLDLACQHACELNCHSGRCPPCKALMKKSCHCGSLVRMLECSSFNALSKEKQLDMLSCKGPCHRKLENCSHLCSEICHDGPCLQLCQKKVTVRCSCQRLRKVCLCFELQSARKKQMSDSGAPVLTRGAALVGFLPCDQDCIKLKAVEQEQNLQQRKASDSEICHEAKKQPKHRKPRAAAHVQRSSKAKELLLIVFKWALVAGLVLIVGMSLYLGAKGLQDLSDWMNEIDTQRPRSRLP